MADEDQDSKTEDPTGKRLSKAHDEGQYPISQEAKTWGTLLAATIIVGILSPGMARTLQRTLVPFIDHPQDIPFEPGNLGIVLVTVFTQMGLVLALPFGTIIAIAVTINYFQVGGWVFKSPFKFDLAKFNPITGLGNMFSKRSLLELAKGVVKLSIVGGIAVSVIMPQLLRLELLANYELEAIIEFMRSMVTRMITSVMMTMFLVLAGDVFYTRWKFTKDLKMTKQEVKDENKQQDGDPMVKARIRRLRVDRARKRMMAAVPHADVVVTNPTHFAVALKYDMETMDAPMCVAKGLDFLALRIRAVADEAKVPIVENPPLARALYASVEIDQLIPPEHYKPVAEVISYVLKLKGKLPR